MATITRRFAVGLTALLLLTSVGVEESAAQAPAATLQIRPAGDVDSSSYPEVKATLSIVDGGGRPVQALQANELSASDETGPVELRKLARRVDAASRVAWVLLIDTSGSMTDRRSDGTTYIEAARRLAQQFVEGTGPNDVVRVVTFNEATTSVTNWLPRSDPGLLRGLTGIQSEQRRTFLSAAITEASSIAANPPPDHDRRAVVLITDMDSRDRDDSLSLDAIRNGLGAPVFTFSLREPSAADEQLTLFLTDLRDYTGGGYSVAGAGSDQNGRLKDLLDRLHVVWDLTLRTDGQPDGLDHVIRVAVTRAGQQLGQGQVPYRSGGLFDVSPLSVEGLFEGDRITGDRTIQATLGGTQWKETRLEVYRDCAPGSCEPVVTSDTTELEYRLQGGALSQGAHELIVRAIVRDDSAREFTDQTVIAFERAGTTLNYGALFLLGGVAAVAIGATGIAIRQRNRVPE